MWKDNLVPYSSQKRDNYKMNYCSIIFTIFLLFAEVALAENQKFKTADGAINIYTKPVPLNLYDVKLKTVGKLRYRGGIHLYSDNKRFGGLSSLSVSVDRQRLISFSDDGMAFYARLIYDRSGNLVGVKDTYFKPLIGLEGQSLTSKFESDAESMAVGMDGEMIVSFERFHRFWRYRPGSFLPERMPGPEAMLRLPYNKGIEALTYFSKGRLIALSESEFSSNSNSVLGWVGHSKGWIELTYLIGGGYRVTGAATLPNGNIMVLERLFSRGGKNAIPSYFATALSSSALIFCSLVWATRRSASLPSLISTMVDRRGILRLVVTSWPL